MKHIDQSVIQESDALPASAAHANVQDSAKDASTANELSRLRKQIVAQSAELAALRWQTAALLKQRPILNQMTRAKRFVTRRFPKVVYRLTHLKRVILNSQAALRPAQTSEVHESKNISISKQLSVHCPVLVADDAAITRRIAAAVPASEVIVVQPAMASSVQAALESGPTLSRPAPGSFEHWLVASPGGTRRLGTIVLNAGDEVGLSLLRGRMVEGQSLLLTPSPGGTPSVASELGAPTLTEAEFVHHTRFPDNWLDPLDAEGQPNPAVVGTRSWPKISVVMVSFNQAVFVEEGLRSVLEQGYPNLEFIVIDGNSTDGSIDILERYRARLSCLVIESDRGQSDGLNKGFDRATGEILTWVNSDDLLEPGALFRVAQAFAAYEVDMVVGGCRQIGLSRSQVIHNHHTKLPFGLPINLPLGLLLEMDRFWLTGSFFYQPEVFFSRDIWLRSGGKLRTDLNYILDYDLWVRMAAAGATIAHIPDFLACSRTHDQQKTTVGMPYLPEVEWLLREYAGHLLDTSPISPR
jgi:hypothetical protein